MKTLAGWLNENYMKRGGMQKAEAVNQMAEDLNASYSTVYKWLKEGDHYIQIPDSGVPSDDGGVLFVFKQVRAIEA